MQRGSKATRCRAPPPAAPPAAEASDDDKPQDPATTQPGKRRKRGAKEAELPALPGPPCFAVGSPVRIATSGHDYQHWRGGADTFYAGLPRRLEWARYAQEFDALERNSTIYSGPAGPKEAAWQSWHDSAAAARPSFKCAVKVPQMFTHLKKLNVNADFKKYWEAFWARCQKLGSHLGPLLFQFPASFKTTSGKGAKLTSNVDRLRRLADLLPSGQGFQFAFEFRDASWFCDEVYAVLQEHNWCLVLPVMTDAPRATKLAKGEGGWIGSMQPGPNPPPERYPLHCCTSLAYVRFHGASGQCCGAYGEREMARWAKRAKTWAAQGRQVWFCFNNDAVDRSSPLPAAIQDCRSLASQLRRMGVCPAA